MKKATECIGGLRLFWGESDGSDEGCGSRPSDGSAEAASRTVPGCREAVVTFALADMRRGSRVRAPQARTM
jgi:hypothetical protein